MFKAEKFTEKANGIIDWMRGELVVIRTGLASPALLDRVKVQSYGALVPLNQVGIVVSEDAHTLRISVWDSGSISQIEQALREADLGVSVVASESDLRVIFPELTGERRAQLLKLAKHKLEEARVSVRGARDEAKKSIEKNVELSDNQKAVAKDSLEKSAAEKNKMLEVLFTKKETEITL